MGRHRHHDNPQNSPRATLGLILCREKYAKDIDKTVFPGTQGGPLVHVVAAKAVCFLEALKPDFIEYQQRVIANAQAMSEALREAGYRIVSGGTDTHLILVDVFSKGIRGRDAEKALDEAWITANKNAIPFDQKPATQSKRYPPRQPRRYHPRLWP